jgi:hypothetical protein
MLVFPVIIVITLDLRKGGMYPDEFVSHLGSGAVWLDFLGRGYLVMLWRWILETDYQDRYMVY